MLGIFCYSLDTYVRYTQRGCGEESVDFPRRSDILVIHLTRRSVVSPRYYFDRQHRDRHFPCANKVGWFFWHSSFETHMSFENWWQSAICCSPSWTVDYGGTQGVEDPDARTPNAAQVEPLRRWLAAKIVSNQRFND